MKKIMLALLLISSTWAQAQNLGCAKPGASMYIDLTRAITQDTSINASLLNEKTVAVEVLNVYPVTKIFAQQLADIDYEQQTGIRLKKEDYFDSYYANEVKSITAKYTFTADGGKKNVYIASSLFNNYECSIRFNGYLTLSREF